MVIALQKKVFIDLDDTLIKTVEIKRAISDICILLGYNPSEVQLAYSATREDYTIERHLQTLKAQTGRGYNGAMYEELVNGLKSRLKAFLFDETISLLESIDRRQYDVYIFTFGNPEFQDWKIEGCGLSYYFDEEHTLKITHEGKADELRGIIDDSETFIIVDDKQRELDTAKAIFGDRAETIQVSDGNLMSKLVFLCEPQGQELTLR